MVSPRGKPEICAAYKHIHIKAALFKHIPHNARIRVSACCVMFFIAPRVKPAVPHFHAHFGHVREHFIVAGKILFNPAAEIKGRQAALRRAVGKVGITRTVRCKQRNVYSAAAIAVP